MFSMSTLLSYMSLRTSPAPSTSPSPPPATSVVEYHPLSLTAPTTQEEIVHKPHPRVHELRKASLDSHALLDGGPSKATPARDDKEADRSGRVRRNTVSGGPSHRHRANTREPGDSENRLRNMQSHPRLDSYQSDFIPPLSPRERDPVSREPTPHREVVTSPAREIVYREMAPLGSPRDLTGHPESTSPVAYIPRGSPPRDPIHREPTPLRESGRTRTRESSRVREGSRARSNTTSSNAGNYDQVRTLMATNEKLSAQLLEVQRELAESRKRTVDALKRVGDFADERLQAIEQLDAAKTEAADKEKASQQRITDLEARLKRRDDEARSLNSRLRSAEDRLQHTNRLLEARTADLTGAQAYLSAADVYSGAEIISMVDALNSEILQLSAFMAEFVEDPAMHGGAPERLRLIDKNKELLEKEIRPKLGETLYAHIEKNYLDLRSDPLPLQLALQSILSAWCNFKVRTFASGQFGDGLDNLYAQMRKSEAQAIAGRWRALTNAQMKYFDNELPTNRLIDMLIALLHFAGWSFASSKSQRCILSVQEKVQNLERMWIQLKNATKTDVTTSDLETFIFPPGVLFDDGMENNYRIDGQGKVTGQKTLCTVAMGLRKTLIGRSEGGSLSTRHETLLKPKVVLVTALSLDGENKQPGLPG